MLPAPPLPGALAKVINDTFGIVSAL